MNNQTNFQNFPDDRRKTRSIEVTPEDIYYLEIDYIDNYYSKKKKIKFPSNIKNDANITTNLEESQKKEKEKNETMPELLNIKDFPAIELREQEIKEKHEDTLHLQTTPIKNSVGHDVKNKIDNVEFSDLKQAENAQIVKKKKDVVKTDSIIRKKPNIFSVEAASAEDPTNDKKTKSTRSRKKAPVNADSDMCNVYFVFNDLASKEFKVPNGIIEDDRSKINGLNIKSNEGLRKSSDMENISTIKERYLVTTRQLQDPKTYEQLKQYTDRDLSKIYTELVRLKYLGKKRINPSDIDFGEVEKFLNSKQIEFIYKKENRTSTPSNTDLKKNLYNSNFNDLFNKLDILKYFTAAKQTEDKIMYFNNIPNFYDDSIRRELASTLNFIKAFKEDYAPIQLQKDNEKFFEKASNENSEKTQTDTSSVTGTTASEKNFSTPNSKTHFIKKKQSALNIKRQCGVSYVVPSESKQLNVEDKYEKLGHLVYQGTHSVDQIQDDLVINYIDNLIISDLINSPIIAVAFESPDEVEMKEYLLFKEKRIDIAKEVFILESIDEIWKFSKDRFFLAINLLYDEDKVVRNFTQDEIKKYTKNELLAMSNIHVGILFRKATSGIKSVLKLYKTGGINKILYPSSYKLCNLNEEDPIDKSMEKFSGLNMTTMSMRIELYVNECKWKNSLQFSKEYLYTFICRLEEKISCLILNWNEYRYLMYLLAKDGKVREYIHSCPYYTLNTMRDNSESIVDLASLNGEKGYEIKIDFFNNLKATDIVDIQENKTDLSNSSLLSENFIKIQNSFADKLCLINNLNFNSLPNPMYVISTRDCFVFDLIVKSEIFEYEDRKILKKEYFFDEKNVPANFYKFKNDKNELRVGVVTYENFYSNEELNDLENCVEKTEDYSLKDAFLPETAQKTFSGDKIKRTKFFFGSRYMWTKKQLSEPNSYVAAGIRKDVSPPPFWMKEKVEEPLVKSGIILKDFVNSFAMNVYHDGTEGLGQHFDDAVRFKQPIYTLRLFSDCRLSFGSQLYGFCNGAFTIPLPRGCICVMEENSYASNGVKHCIRPCDMTGKSSALILRQMHPSMIREAEKYDFHIDFPCWFSSLSIHPNSLPYTQQKTVECDMLTKLNEIEKKKINADIIKNSYDEEIFDVVSSMVNTIEFYTESYVPSMTPNLAKKKKGRVAGKQDY